MRERKSTGLLSLTTICLFTAAKFQATFNLNTVFSLIMTKKARVNHKTQSHIKYNHIQYGFGLFLTKMLRKANVLFVAKFLETNRSDQVNCKIIS